MVWTYSRRFRWLQDEVPWKTTIHFDCFNTKYMFGWFEMRLQLSFSWSESGLSCCEQLYILTVLTYNDRFWCVQLWGLEHLPVQKPLIWMYWTWSFQFFFWDQKYGFWGVLQQLWFFLFVWTIEFNILESIRELSFTIFVSAFSMLQESIILFCVSFFFMCTILFKTCNELSVGLNHRV